jgi:hypothetical protein
MASTLIIDDDDAKITHSEPLLLEDPSTGILHPGETFQDGHVTISI